MTKISIERFSASHGEKNRAQCHQTDDSVIKQK